MIKEAEIIREVPFVRLEEVRDYKTFVNRDKDKNDVKLIDQFLSTTSKDEPTALGIETYQELLDIFKKEIDKRLGDKILSLVIFGSVSRGEAKGSSDIDMFTFFDDSKIKRSELNEVLISIILDLRKTDEYVKLTDKKIYPEIYPFLISKSKADDYLWVFFDATEQGIIIKDTDNSIDIVYKVIMMNEQEAKSYLLQKGFNEAQADDILKRTHCSPPEDYFITSEDMVGKSGVWAHFGSWDFDRANIWVNAKGKTKDETIDFILKRTTYNKEEAEKIYFEINSMKDEREANNWIAPWPSYASGPVGCALARNSTIITCGNGVQINISTYESFVPTQNGIKSLDAISYMENGVMLEKKSQNNTAGVSASLIKNPSDSSSYAIILAQSPLHKSMFHRLFYMNGDGLKHFEKLTEKRGLSGQNIIVWKVNWEGIKKSVNSENSTAAITVG